MRRWIVLAACVAALSCVKVYAFKFNRPTEIRLSPPWFAPIDSPQANCIRNDGEMLFICAVADAVAKEAASMTIAKVGICEPCYRASLALALIEAGRPDAPEPRMPEG